MSVLVQDNNSLLRIHIRKMKGSLMSMVETKNQLIQLLADKENKVIALSGKWGTGKSHLWNEVRKASGEDGVKNALYVSLFGLSDMSQIKLKIIQSALPYADSKSVAWEKITGAMNSAKTVLKGFHRGFSALDELALLAVPAILNNKVIVLDDIERKHEKLSIDEILGFIDEFTQRHGARFILILNSDQLLKKEIWNTLREKVVDQELRLDTSSKEAFGIAIVQTKSAYAEMIENSVITCRITNIRIICKVIKAVNRILGDRTNLEDALLLKVIPSIVLLATINYKGIENGPDFQYVLARGSGTDWSEYFENKDKELNEQGKRQAEWKLLLNELGIHACDEFEVLVVQFLESGLFDLTKLNEIITRYASETDVFEARERAQQFRKDLFWDHRINEAELLQKAKDLISIAHHLDPFTATDLKISMAEMPEEDEIGEAIVNEWLKGFKAKGVTEYVKEDPFNRPLDAVIKAEFAAIKVQAQAKTTVFDACMHIAEHSGWGAMQVVALKSAAVADFDLMIRTLEIEDLRKFMRKMIEMRLNRAMYDEHFGSATDYFVDACKKIVIDSDSARLGKLVQRLFKDAGIAGELAITASETESSVA